MTRVDFYILPDMDTDARSRFACRLARKAVDAGKHVYLYVADEAAGRDLDELMWSYPPQRFLPHALCDAPHANRTPVLIGCTAPPAETDQTMINLSNTVPEFFGRFERVAEILVTPELEAGRQRYGYYRDCGYPLHHHELESWEE